MIDLHFLTSYFVAMLHRLTFLLLLLSPVLTTAVRADILVLNDGRLIVGEVLEEKPSGVLFHGKIAGIWGKVFYAKNLIDRIDREEGNQGPASEDSTGSGGKGNGQPSKGPNGTATPKATDPKPEGGRGQDTKLPPPQVPPTQPATDEADSNEGEPDSSIGDIVRRSEESKELTEQAIADLFQDWTSDFITCKLSEKPRVIQDHPRKKINAESEVGIVLSVDLMIDHAKWDSWTQLAIQRLEAAKLPSKKARGPGGLALANDQNQDGTMGEFEADVVKQFSKTAARAKHALLRGSLVRYKRGSPPEIIKYNAFAEIENASIDLWNAAGQSGDQSLGSRIALGFERKSDKMVKLFLLPPSKENPLPLHGRPAVRFLALDKSGDPIELGDGAICALEKAESRLPAQYKIDATLRRAGSSRAGSPSFDFDWIVYAPFFVTSGGGSGLASDAVTLDFVIVVPKSAAMDIDKIVPEYQLLPRE
jgi:hypothetical protein